MPIRLAMALSVVTLLLAGGCAHFKKNSYMNRPPLNRVSPFLVATDAQGTMALYEKVDGFEDLGSLAFEPSEEVLEDLNRDPIPKQTEVVECISYTASTTLPNGTTLQICGMHCSDGSSYSIACGADIFQNGFDKIITE